MFKGEIKLKQKWFDEFKDKMSTKSLILAGNVEQAVIFVKLCCFQEGFSPWSTSCEAPFDTV